MNKIAYESGRKYASYGVNPQALAYLVMMSGLGVVPGMAGLASGAMEPEYPVRTGIGTGLTSALGGLGGIGSGVLANYLMDSDKENALYAPAIGSLLGSMGGGYLGNKLIPEFLNRKKYTQDLAAKK